MTTQVKALKSRARETTLWGADRYLQMECTPEQEDQAIRVLAGYANDAEDLSELLDMLGLKDRLRPGMFGETSD